VYGLLVRWWAALHADAGDLFCLPFCDAPGQVRDVLDAPSPRRRARRPPDRRGAATMTSG
jgi:hypothetical protein